MKNLQAFRGIQLVTAVGLAAEIGDFQRFPRAAKFMAFVGLVPRENSSGQTRRQGGLTKAGNRHVRRLLIEAAWQYIGAPATPSQKLVDRRVGVPETVIAIADRSLRRLRHKSHILSLRKKSATKIAAALARELAGFVWAAARATAGIETPSRPTPKPKPKTAPRPAAVNRKATGEPSRAASPKRLAAAGATRLK